MMTSGLAAVALAGSAALVPAVASAQALISVSVPVSVSVPGTVGSSVTCLNGNCINLQGVSDLKVKAAVNVNGLTLPVVTPAPVPGCSSAIQAGATITPLRLGGGSGVTVTISYVKPGATSPTTSTLTIPLVAGGRPVTITECASV
jgi:hypothetical protein